MADLNKAISDFYFTVECILDFLTYFEYLKLLYTKFWTCVSVNLFQIVSNLFFPIRWYLPWMRNCDLLHKAFKRFSKKTYDIHFLLNYYYILSLNTFICQKRKICFYEMKNWYHDIINSSQFSRLWKDKSFIIALKIFKVGTQKLKF